MRCETLSRCRSVAAARESCVQPHPWATLGYLACKNQAKGELHPMGILKTRAHSYGGGDTRFPRLVERRAEDRALGKVIGDFFLVTVLRWEFLT